MATATKGQRVLQKSGGAAGGVKTGLCQKELQLLGGEGAAPTVGAVKDSQKGAQQHSLLALLELRHAVDHLDTSSLAGPKAPQVSL